MPQRRREGRQGRVVLPVLDRPRHRRSDARRHVPELHVRDDVVASPSPGRGLGRRQRRRAQDFVRPLGVEARDAPRVCVREHDLRARAEHRSCLARRDRPLGEIARRLPHRRERRDGVERAPRRDQRIDRVQRAVRVPEREIRHVVEALRLGDRAGEADVVAVDVAEDRRHEEQVVECRGQLRLVRGAAPGERNGGSGACPRRRGRSRLCVERERRHLGHEVRLSGRRRYEREPDLQLDRAGHAPLPRAREVEVEVDTNPRPRRRRARRRRVPGAPDDRVRPGSVRPRREVDHVAAEAARHPPEAAEAPGKRLRGRVERHGLGRDAAAQVVVEVDDDVPDRGGSGVRVPVVRGVRGRRDLDLDGAVVEGDAVRARGGRLGRLVEGRRVPFLVRLRPVPGCERHHAEHAVVLISRAVEMHVREAEDGGVPVPVAGAVEEIDGAVFAARLGADLGHSLRRGCTGERAANAVAEAPRADEEGRHGGGRRARRHDRPIVGNGCVDSSFGAHAVRTRVLHLHDVRPAVVRRSGRGVVPAGIDRALRGAARAARDGAPRDEQTKAPRAVATSTHVLIESSGAAQVKARTLLWRSGR